jgi:glycine betaine/proline transport system substrate-binding protein
MKIGITALCVCFFFLNTSFAQTSSCNTVRFADVGWADVTVITALVSHLFEQKGWHTQTHMLSVPVAFMGLRNGDIDVFLGNWMPTQKSMITPYLDEGSVVSLVKNLDNARYTLAVPSYVYEQGVHSAEDLHKHARRFNNTLYGIEAGNDGNLTILKMIQENTYGLGHFNLVESSEQSMLAEVQKKIQNKEWVVFLGWQPHPMNTVLSMRYLEDPLHAWGPQGGLASVYTLVSKKFHEKCPDVSNALKSMVFSIEMENHLMDYLLNKHFSAQKSVSSYFEKNPQTYSQWLSYVPDSVEKKNTAQKPTVDKEPTRKIGNAVSSGIQKFNTFASTYTRLFSKHVETSIQTCVDTLTSFSAYLIIFLACVLAYAIHRKKMLVLGVATGLSLIVHMGFWNASVETVVLVGLSSIVSLAIGIPLGVLCAHKPRLYVVLRPLLDMMQTIPTFVYLIPSLMLFGLGIVPGLISTVVFACPTSIRLMHACLVHIPKDYADVSVSFHASVWQRLWHIEIPFAIPTLWTSVNQTLMMGLSMVVISALVGSGGLGVAVIRSLNTVDIATGFEAGLAIVVLAMIMDRTLCQPTPRTAEV